MNQDSVKEVQTILRYLDRLNNDRKRIAVDGCFDSRTKEAVTEFQKAYGLPPSGEVDYETWEMLYQVYEYEQRENARPKKISLFASDCHIEREDSGTHIFVVQHLLKELERSYDDFGTIELTGVYDEATENAVRVFQRKNLMESTGVLDTPTYNMLVDEYEKNILFS